MNDSIKTPNIQPTNEPTTSEPYSKIPYKTARRKIAIELYVARPPYHGRSWPAADWRRAKRPGPFHILLTSNTRVTVRRTLADLAKVDVSRYPPPMAETMAMAMVVLAPNRWGLWFDGCCWTMEWSRFWQKIRFNMIFVLIFWNKIWIHWLNPCSYLTWWFN